MYTKNLLFNYEVYECNVKNDPKIKSNKTTKVISKSGQHVKGRTDNDEIYFFVMSKTVSYFPSGLEKIFTSLVGISICYCGLKEVKQNDLKPHTKLTFLNLNFNEIEILDEGLFDFNLILKHVGLEGNNFIHINPTIFDKLFNLVSLCMFNNKCIDECTKSDAGTAKKIIRNVKINCRNPIYSRLDDKLTKFEDELKYLTMERKINFTNDLSSFQVELNSSIFAFSIADLQERSQNLLKKVNSTQLEMKNEAKESNYEWMWTTIVAVFIIILIAIGAFIRFKMK